MSKMYTKSINVSEDVHAKLEELKTCPREPYNDVIERLLPKDGVD